ncbi:MAG: vWA domain-containing protein [Pirellulales bacterium]
MWSIEPKIPLSLWWAIVVAAVAAVVFYAMRSEWSIAPKRRAAVVSLLGLGLVGPLLIALNPTWIETIPPIPGNPLVTVLVDGTQSMRTEDGEPDGGSKTRWQRALELAAEVESNGTKVDVRKMVFDESLSPLEIAIGKNSGSKAVISEGNDKLGDWPRGHRSDLAAALRQSTRTGSPLGHAVLLVSDGAHNVGSVDSVLQAAQDAGALATPIYTVTLGHDVGMKNMSIAARAPRMIAFPDAPTAISAKLGHNGLAGLTTEVTLLKDDQPIETKRVRLADDPNQEVRFVLKDGATEPLERYRVTATEVAGEATVADNQTSILVQRLEAPIGVLLLEGKPYWDSKFLTRNLGGDPVVELTSVVQLGPKRFLRKKIPRTLNSLTAADSPSVNADASLDSSNSGNADAAQEPAAENWEIERDLESPLESPELLEQYRMVVLGRDADVYLTEKAVANIRNWVSRSGGCLLCARGAPSDHINNKLAEMLPVRWTESVDVRFRTQITRFGMDTAVFDPLVTDGLDPLGTLPSLATSAVVKPRAGLPQVLVQGVTDIEGGSVPVVTYQPFGTGQAIVVEGAGMWRWAFLPPQHASKDKIYSTLWQSLIQWVISQQDLMPGQKVGIRSDRAVFLAGDRVTASVVLRDVSQFQDESGRLDLAVLLQSVDGSLPKRFSIAPAGDDEELYQVDFGSLDVGNYTAQVVQGSKDTVIALTPIEVRDPWFESLEVDARPDLMRKVSQLSGGSELRPVDVKSLVAKFNERLAESRADKVIRKTLWDRPLVLLVILGGWITTWIVRRQSGLV